MKKWEDITAAVTGNWPGTLNINESAPDNFDGTPLLAEWVNNLWGWVQDVLTRADLSPDGNVEAEGASQISSAIQRMKGLPGEGMVWWGQLDPGSISDPPRVLLLDGSTILVANYQELVDNTHCLVGGVTDLNLFSEFGTDAGFYRCNLPDGTDPNASGIYFKLPDLRGYFLRGLDTSGDVDQQNPLVTGWVGYQGLRNHSHYITDKEYLFDSGTRRRINDPLTANAAAGTDITCPIVSTSSTNQFFASYGGGTPNNSETTPPYKTCHFAIWY